MKKNIEKHICTSLGAFAGMMSAVSLTAFAQSGTDADVNAVASPIFELFSRFMPALLVIVASVGILYCAILGLKYSKTEGTRERELALEHLKSSVIGFVIIFVLILALSILTDFMSDWAGRASEAPTDSMINLISRRKGL